MELLYQEQTKQLIGAIIKVYNSLGYGYHEKEYQKAYAEELMLIGWTFSRELYSFLKYNGKIIRKYFLDFLVVTPAGKIVIELKVANGFYKQHFAQVLQYMQNNNVRLGLVFVITPSKVIIKRVIHEAARSA